MLLREPQKMGTSSHCLLQDHSANIPWYYESTCYLLTLNLCWLCSKHFSGLKQPTHQPLNGGSLNIPIV